MCEKVFVGIDQSLVKAGICVIKDGFIVYSNRIAVPRHCKGTPRLVFLRDELQTQLLPFKSNIAHASLEAQSLGSIGDIDQLGQINGVVQVLLSDMGVLQPFKVSPAALKKFVANHSQANKERMIQVSYETWGILFKNDDECDAHGLARISEEYIEKKSSKRHQLEVVYNLSHPRARTKKLFYKTS